MQKSLILLASLAVLVAASPLPAQEPNPALAELKANEQAGDPEAQDKLGDTCRTHCDLEGAVAWYRPAARQGILNSQYQLAHILLTWANSSSATRAVSAKHFDEALPYALKAATQGHKRAQLELGQLYRDGKLLRKDLPEAYKWFCLAADGPPLDLTVSLATSARDNLFPKMTQDQISDGNQRVTKFLARSDESTPAPEPACFQNLKLQGITGTPGRPIAIINGKTLAPNETTTLKIDARPLTLRCLNINSNYAIVAIDGFPAPKTLSLP